ncbi:MAG: serine/threonine protein kinase [Sandaracinaceae bacterium]|nr:serine/threonine protein kinase [Sandaracinaceae bacterium]
MTEEGHAPASMPRVGPYELLRRIGVGGMATVYLARLGGVEGFTRIYALKVLHPHLATQPEIVTMLMDEARIASRIQHPNVVGIVDLGESDEGVLYIAMEYVDGVSLDRLLAPKPNFRPHRLIVPIAMDALLGLAASHDLVGDDGRSLELVHRDVSPGNLLVGTDGIARITDFGTAKARARATRTMPGVVKGKVGYVAPEVALGRAFDRRADVFSMGVLLWNALTGQRLYDTDDIAKNVAQLATLDVPPPSTIGLGPPALFDEPILTALARSPDRRFPDARAMYEALEDALAMSGGEPPRRQIGEWVETSFARLLEKRRELADPDFEVRPVELSSDEGEDATRSFRTVPGETSELAALAAPEWMSAGPAASEAGSTEPPPTEPPPADEGSDRTFRLALLFVVMLVLGLATGVGILFLLTQLA